MLKVSIEVHSKTARFEVAVQAHSIQRALSIVEARYPGSVARMIFPLAHKRSFVEDAAA